MTSSLQMYARQTQTPIDILRFKAYVANKTVKEVTSAPDIGINIYGAFLEGARWNWDN